MFRVAVVAGILGTALWAAPGAAAQQVTGEFGGGAVSQPPAPAHESGNMVIGLRSADGVTVQIVATMVGHCASGSFSASVPVAADGSFAATGAVRQARTSTRYELRGVLTERPSGTATARFERETATNTRTCSALDVVWEARRPPAAGVFGMAAAIPPGGGLLLGTTNQLDNGVPRGIALRIAPDGRSLSRAIYGVRMSCTGAGTSPTFDLPRDNLPIGPDGRVSDSEQGTVRTQTSILKYVEQFAGTLGSAGGEGVFTVELSVRRRSTGKRVTLCRSGEVRWAASY